MSYTSTNTFLKSTVLERVFDIIGWLGYEKYPLNPNIPNQIGSYMWSGDKDFQSFVGVELQVYQDNGIITVDTRTRLGRSYWDLELQNKTIKTLYDFFGGSFVTDEGENILFPKDEEEPTRLEAGLYIHKWKHYNSIEKLSVLNQTYEIQGEFKLSGISYIDEFNPNIVLNNLQIPFLVGAWEEYLKSTFVVLTKCSSEKDRERIFKKLLSKAKVQPDNVESFSQNSESVEWLLTEFIPFQRPQSIVENFKIIDERIDINGVFMKPTPNQTQSLFDRIDNVVIIRNNIVHHGRIYDIVTDDVIKQFIEDFNEAVDRTYRCLNDYYKLDYRQDEYYFKHEDK